MQTYTILHEIGIKASPEAVYQALTDTKQLAGWWTSDIRGSGARVGDVLEFWFGEVCHAFEVEALEPGRLVRWKSDQRESIAEWAGTTVAFSLHPDGKQCRLRFSHSGWRRDDGILPHSTTKWAVFMLSLKDLLEKGRGQPAPHDVHVNHD